MILEGRTGLVILLSASSMFTGVMMLLDNGVEEVPSGKISSESVAILSACSRVSVFNEEAVGCVLMIEVGVMEGVEVFVFEVEEIFEAGRIPFSFEDIEDFLRLMLEAKILEKKIGQGQTYNERTTTPKIYDNHPESARL